MEKIKFKIWDKHTKVMSEPFEITELVDFNLIWKEKFKGQKEVSFCDLVWLQWTGLIDKNGIDIYNGDIFKYVLEASGKHDKDTEYTEEVHFNDGSFELDNCFLGIFYNEGIVIGNIYEDSCLLE